MRRRRLAAVLGLLVLAPIGAEYLVGYDTSTGDWPELLAGLVFFAPLYGGPALIIREVAVRAGVGWPGRLCWAAAFGVVQAGLVDQSLFNRSYRDIAYWESMVGPTWVPALGLSLAASLSFVVGHMLWSITAPTIVVESLLPSVRERPWLGRVALGVVVLGYLTVSVLVLGWHLDAEGAVAGPGQLVGAAVVVLALIGLGLRLRPRRRPDRAGRVPHPFLVGLGALLATVAFDLSQSRPGFLLSLTVLVGGLAVVARFSRTPGWSDRHALLLVGGLLLARALTGFLVDPIGDGPLVAKYVHNTAAVLLVLVLVAIGWVGTTRRELAGSARTDGAPRPEPATVTGHPD